MVHRLRLENLLEKDKTLAFDVRNLLVNRVYAKPFHGLRFTVSNRETKPQKKMCMRKNHDFRFTAQYAMEAQIGLKS